MKTTSQLLNSVLHDTVELMHKNIVKKVLEQRDFVLLLDRPDCSTIWCKVYNADSDGPMELQVKGLFHDHGITYLVADHDMIRYTREDLLNAEDEFVYQLHLGSDCLYYTDAIIQINENLHEYVG